MKRPMTVNWPYLEDGMYRLDIEYDDEGGDTILFNNKEDAELEFFEIDEYRPY